MKDEDLLNKRVTISFGDALCEAIIRAYVYEQCYCVYAVFEVISVITIDALLPRSTLPGTVCIHYIFRTFLPCKLSKLPEVQSTVYDRFPWESYVLKFCVGLTTD